MQLGEAQRRLLKNVTPLPVQDVAVTDALGRWLAEPLMARVSRPARDQSAMDGYALRAADGMASRRMIGESAAGRAFPESVGPNECVRISTGATMPDGADCVLIQEFAERSHDVVTPRQEIKLIAGKHVRTAGFDFRSGNVLLPPHQRIGPAQIGLAASSGHSTLPVRRRPTVGIIECGDELLPGPDGIAPSNGAMLSAMIDDALPCIGRRMGPVPDDIDRLIHAFEQAADCDVIVTSGGASVGDHDLLGPALRSWGAEIDFWKVAIRPGKPLLLARRDKITVIGLPGNPVSSFVTAYLFVLPFLRHLSGSAAPFPVRHVASTKRALEPGGDRTEFLRAIVSGKTIEVIDQRDSSALMALAMANALVERPAGCRANIPGDDVPFFRFENGGIA